MTAASNRPGAGSSGEVLEIQSSPHVGSPRGVEAIMLNVVVALLPATAWAIYAFGLSAAATISTAVGCCLLFEHVLSRGVGASSTIGDWSAVITGLLLGLVLPPGLPLWMTVVGAAVSIGVGKHLFGGLGYNAFNPALVGRAVLQAAFPVPMTTWFDSFVPGRFAAVPASTLAPPLTRPMPPSAGAPATADAVTANAASPSVVADPAGDSLQVASSAIDGFSGATPLASWKFDGQLTDVADLVAGYTSGSTGETAAGLIALGGLYLIARKMMNWRIPAVILGTVAVVSAAAHGLAPHVYPPATFMLFSGGLMLGAMFMATDMVGSPMTNLGCALYGLLIGGLVVVIRLWGGMPEGVMYAVLLGNAATPHIDQLIRPRVFGTARRAAARGRPA